MLRSSIYTVTVYCFLWVFGILGCVHGMHIHSVFGLQLAPPQLAPLSSLFPSFVLLVHFLGHPVCICVFLFTCWLVFVFSIASTRAGPDSSIWFDIWVFGDAAPEKFQQRLLDVDPPPCAGVLIVAQYEWQCHLDTSCKSLHWRASTVWQWTVLRMTLMLIVTVTCVTCLDDCSKCLPLHPHHSQLLVQLLDIVWRCSLFVVLDSWSLWCGRPGFETWLWSTARQRQVQVCDSRALDHPLL